MLAYCATLKCAVDSAIDKPSPMTRLGVAGSMMTRGIRPWIMRAILAVANAPDLFFGGQPVPPGFDPVNKIPLRPPAAPSGVSAPPPPSPGPRPYTLVWPSIFTSVLLLPPSCVALPQACLGAGPRGPWN